MVGDSCTVLQTLTDSSTNGAQNKTFKNLRDTTCVDCYCVVWMLWKTCQCLTHDRVSGKWLSTVWHKMAPGLGERSTAYPGQLAWAALNKTIHIHRKKRTEQRQSHTTENRIKQTNELIKKRREVIIHASDRIFSFFLLFSPPPSFSWGCNFVNQVLSILT